MNRNQRAALANPNLEFGASTFLGIPVGPNQMLAIMRLDDEGQIISKVLYDLSLTQEGTRFIIEPDGKEIMVLTPSDKLSNLISVEPSYFEALVSGQTYLKEIINIEYLKVIPPSAFAGNENLSKIGVINATEVHESAFSACSSLTKVEMPNVIDVHSEAFMGCTSAIIVLNDNVQSVGSDAFSDIDNLIYHGSLPGAPWGAKKWNGVPQN